MRKTLAMLVVLSIVLSATLFAGQTAEELYLSGNMKAGAGKYEAAVQDYDKAAAMDPKMDKACRFSCLSQTQLLANRLFSIEKMD